MKSLLAIDRAFSRSRTYVFAVLATLIVGLASAISISRPLLETLSSAPQYFKGQELVSLEVVSANSSRPMPLFQGRYMEYKERSTSLKDFCSGIVEIANVARGTDVNAVRVGYVTPSFFNTFNIEPVIGRKFAERESENEQLALITFGFWEEVFEKKTTVLGEIVHINGKPVTIIGVLPRTFAVPPLMDARLYLVLHLTHDASDVSAATTSRPTYARLKQGHTISTAEAELQAIQSGDGQRNEQYFRNFKTVLRPLNAANVRRDGNNSSEVRKLDAFAISALILTLALTITTAGGLMLGRSINRRREVGIKLALGASRRHVASEVLMEAIWLCVMAGVGALLLVNLLAPMIERLVEPSELTILRQQKTNWVQSSVAMAAAAISVLSSALVPIYYVAHQKPSDVIKGRESYYRTAFAGIPLRSLMVIAQVASSVCILASLFLAVFMFSDVYSRKTGLDISRRINFNIYMPYLKQGQFGNSYYKLLDLLGRVKDIPGVQGSAISSGYFPRAAMVRDVKRVQDRDNEVLQVDAIVVSDAFFEVAGARMVRGSSFGNNVEGGGGIVINEMLARRLFPKTEPVGSVIVVGRGSAFTIIGVVENITARLSEPRPAVYLHYSQMGMPPVFDLIVNYTAGVEPNLSHSVRDILYRMDPSICIFRSETFETMTEKDILREKSALKMLAVLAIVATILSIVGMLAIIKIEATVRAREFAIRRALGSPDIKIYGKIFSSCFMLIVVGSALGLVAGVWFSRIVFALFGGVHLGNFDIFIAFALPPSMLGIISIPICYFASREMVMLNFSEMLNTDSQ